VGVGGGHGCVSRVCFGGTGLCDTPICRGEESYRVCVCVCVCDMECDQVPQ
jgi:hypothetical protein